MSKYVTRLNVLWAVVAPLRGVSQLSKAAEVTASQSWCHWPQRFCVL
jgi:hypothetical protein